MKRKLVQFDVFKKIEGESLSRSERELSLAKDVLAKTLGVNGLNLHCYGENTVTYQTLDGNYVHAGYKLGGNDILFENIEELVIDESSEKQAASKMLSDLVDNLVKNETAQADELFRTYISLPVVRRNLLSEAKADKKSFSFVKGKDKDKSKSKKKGMAARIFLKGVDKKNSKRLEEWGGLCQNICGYLEYKKMGPVLKESKAKYDDKGNPVSVRIPTSQARNEGKILSFNWKSLNTDVVTKRTKAKLVKENSTFWKAMSDLKRANGLSDTKLVQETLEAIVAAWPELLYLTHNELAQSIGESLEAASVRNWDDNTCNVLAEAILNTAFTTYEDHAAKIMALAGIKEMEKVYESFKTTVDAFYPNIDDNTKTEMQVYADMYQALYEVHSIALANRDEVLKSQTVPHMRDLLAVVQEHIEPDLEIVEAAVDYLSALVEANVPMASDTWDVSNTPHISVSGDHPRMEKLAKVPGIAGTYNGDWGDNLPVSDGKSYKGNEAKKMKDSWMNVGGDEVYPAVKNPYIPEPSNSYKMKEKSVVNDDNLLAQWQSSDTWPNLQNPVTPKNAVTPKTYKMKSDNLVVDQ